MPADAVWQYRDDIWRLARRLCESPEDAEDVTQTTLLKGSLHAGTFRRDASLRTWLHRITRNECRMLRRSSAARRLVSLDQIRDTGRGALAEPTADVPDPEQAAIAAERRRTVAAALRGLPDRYRLAVLLKDGLGFTAADVAAAMGISVPAARSVLHRARRALRRRLTWPGRSAPPTPAGRATAGSATAGSATAGRATQGQAAESQVTPAAPARPSRSPRSPRPGRRAAQPAR